MNTYAHIKLKQNKVLRILLYPAIWSRKLFIAFRRSIYLFFFESIFERIKKGTIAVEVPWFDGIFFMDAKSHTLIRITAFNEYEKGLAHIVSQKMQSGGDGIDIGANIGFYTVLMAKSAKTTAKVISVEPNLQNIIYLKKNLAENNVESKVIIFEGIAGKNKKAQVKLNWAEGFEEHSRTGEVPHPKTKEGKIKYETVKRETVDHLVQKYNLRPSVIKIDTEGADYFVLKGAAKSIKRFRPIIICEFNQETQKDYKIAGRKILDFFKSNNYSVIFAEKEIILAKPIR